MARKEKKYHFIYKTTNNLSGRYYIGMHSTNNLDDGYLGSGNRIILAIRKHGKENFTREILEFYDSRFELKKKEEEILTLDEIAKKDCMNLVVGGGGFMMDDYHYKCSKTGGKAFKQKLKENEEFREKHKKIVSFNMKDNHKKGKIKYDTFRDKQHTDETKRLMSEKKRNTGCGEENSQYGTCWIQKNGENKKIKKEDLKFFEVKGWIKGRKLK